MLSRITQNIRCIFELLFYFKRLIENLRFYIKAERRTALIMNSFLGKFSDGEKTILKLLVENETMTKNDIIKKYDVKLTTLNRMMDSLLERKIVKVVGEAESTGGRKPRIYSLDDENFYLIGIDISGTRANIVITNLKMKMLAQEKFPLKPNSLPEDAINRIKLIVDKHILNLNIKKENLIGIGVGSIGPINMEDGTYGNIEYFNNKSWCGFPLKKTLENIFHLPVLIDNGVNTAVLGEYLLGNGKGDKNIAYFNCGTKLASGFISNGIILRGKIDRADSFSHQIVNFQGDKCECGNYGCVATYSSIPAITKKYMNLCKLNNLDFKINTSGSISFSDICTKANKEDSLCISVIKEASSALAIGIYNYINLLHPDIIILNGPIIRNIDVFFDMVKEALSKRNNDISTKVEIIKGGIFKDNEIAISAALMFFIKNIYEID